MATEAKKTETTLHGFENCRAVIVGNELVMRIPLDKVARPAGRPIKDKKGGEKAAVTHLVATSGGYRWFDTQYGKVGVSMNINREPTESDNNS